MRSLTDAVVGVCPELDAGGAGVCGERAAAAGAGMLPELRRRGWPASMTQWRSVHRDAMAQCASLTQWRSVHRDHSLASRPTGQ